MFDGFEATRLADFGVLACDLLDVSSVEAVLDAAPATTAGPNVSDNDGRGFGLARATVFAPDGGFIERTPLDVGVGAACFGGDCDLGDGRTELWLSSWRVREMLLALFCGVKPKPPSEVLDAGFALAGALFTTADDLPNCLAKFPSLVPGLLAPLLPSRLRLEAGRGGGGMGLSIGEKKLDRRLSLGVDGRFWMLSIVRSLKEGRDDLLFSATAEASSRWMFSGGSVGEISRELGRDADR